MTLYLRSLPDLTRVSVASLVAYRAEMTIWILTATFPFIMLALWNAVAEDGPVAGYGQAEMARYFSATLVVRQLTSAWLVWHLNYEIRSGEMSIKLLKPVHPLWQSGVVMLCSMPFRILILSPFLVLLVVWRPELWAVPTLDAAFLFAVSVSLAWLMSFLIQGIIGTLSFWFDKTDGLFGLWFGLWMLLSGYIAPLQVYPEPVRAALTWLPFRGMLAVPVELLGGFLSARDALLEVGIQLGWVVAMGCGLHLLWRAGVRRYGAFGA